MFNRISGLIAKRRRAFDYGIWLGKSSSFKLPKKIRLAGKPYPLNLPDEQGVSVAFQELLFADSYGLKKFPRSMRTVLDIGGNVGVFCLAARNAYPDALIHSYEPNPALEQYLKVQAGAANTTYFMEAVDTESGHVSLQFDTDSVHTRSHSDQAGKITATAFRTVIDRMGGKINLAKIDCEGAEWNLFKDEASWQKIEYLTMEYHLFDGQSHDDIPVTLNRLGFRVLEQDRASHFGLVRAVHQSIA